MRKLGMNPFEVLKRFLRKQNLESGVSYKELMPTDNFWQYFVPKNQQLKGENKEVFMRNLGEISKKLGFNPFLSTDKKFILSDDLTDLELQQMLLWLSGLDFEEVELPTEEIITRSFPFSYNFSSENKLVRCTKQRYIQWSGYFSVVRTSKLYVSLHPDTADLIIPVLPYLPIYVLSLYPSSSNCANSLSAKQLADLGTTLTKMNSSMHLEISTYGQAGLSLPLFENLLKTEISVPFSLTLKGLFTPEELQIISQLLKKNPSVYSLTLTLYPVNKGVPDFISQLRDSHLKKLQFSQCESILKENFRILAASLPKSLESLELDYCGLEDYQCERLLPILPGSKINTLNLEGNKLRHFPDDLGRILNQTAIVSLNFRRNPDHPSFEKICEALKDPACKMEIFEISECRPNRGSLLLPAAIRENSSLQKLWIHELWGCYYISDREEIIPNFYDNLILAMSMNFSILDGGFIYHANDGKYAKNFNIFKYRNSRLHDARELLKEIRLGNINSESEIFEALNEIIPSKLAEALEFSKKLQGEYPDAHAACEKLSGEIDEEASRLNTKNKLELANQGVFSSSDNLCEEIIDDSGFSQLEK